MLTKVNTTIEDLQSIADSNFSKTEPKEWLSMKNFPKIKRRAFNVISTMDFDHIQAKCENTLENMKMLFFFTWSDEESSSKSDLDNENLRNYVAFTTKVSISIITDPNIDDDSKGESNDEFLHTYKITLQK